MTLGYYAGDARAHPRRGARLGAPRRATRTQLARHPTGASLGGDRARLSRSPTPTTSASSSPRTKPVTRSPLTSAPRTASSRSCRSSSDVRPSASLLTRDTEERFTRDAVGARGHAEDRSRRDGRREPSSSASPAPGPSSDLHRGHGAGSADGRFLRDGLLADLLRGGEQRPLRHRTSLRRCSRTKTPRKKSTTSCGRTRTRCATCSRRTGIWSRHLRDALSSRKSCWATRSPHVHRRGMAQRDPRQLRLAGRNA